MARVTHIRRLGRNEGGSTLVEFAIALALFLLIFFIAIDFGRMMFQYTSIEKSLQMAARIATVRPAACTGVPDTNVRDPAGTGNPRFGTLCKSGTQTCLNPGTKTCTAASASGNNTVEEIWGRLTPLLPPSFARENLRFTYEFDQDLGFLGGPYVPIVTVSLENYQFQPISALPGLTSLMTGSAFANTIDVRDLSVSLPGEDLDVGTNG